MALVSEPVLPDPRPQSNLRKARDIVIEQVQAWMGTHVKHATIGHIGPVTQEFIMQQAGMAPRSIITVIDGEAERVGHGMTIQCTPTFVWYVIVRGVLADRTTDALDFIGHALRFIYADVFRDPEADPGKIFSKPPVAKSVKFRSRYMTKDEKTAYTVIGISWLQEISLGAAGRERPGDGILTLINGTDTYPGDPNDDDVPFKVE
jgi:hypothetical protein